MIFKLRRSAPSRIEGSSHTPLVRKKDYDNDDDEDFEFEGKRKRKKVVIKKEENVILIFL